jgi:hypothetical protein
MTQQRDWGGLRSILEEAKVLNRVDKDTPLVACPLCGTPLNRNSRGESNCPLGHYRTSAQTLGEAGLA